MKEFLTSLFGEAVTDDSMAKFNEELGKRFVSKADYNAKTTDLKEAKETIRTMTTEVETLKTSGADAEEWKTKFETLQQDIKQKEETARQEREAAERKADIKARFDAVCVDKDGKPLEFSHPAIRASYEAQFGEAIYDDANKSKSDGDVFYTLTKDDGAAFKGVQMSQVNLPGASPLGGGATGTDTLLGALQEKYTK